jgi:hypothetical protein
MDQQAPDRVHYNKPQLRSMAIMAQHEVAIWGRGTGKSDGLIAPRMAHNAFAMPRSLGGLEARSFAQILTRTLPPVVRGLERLGYKLERDFTVRERGPRAWQLPLMPPLRWENTIHFRNGSAIALISQQNPGSANGLSLDWLIADEAKYLKRDQHEEEVLPAMRGNKERFGSLSCHQSTLLCSDMPTSPSARWLLEKESEMDPACIDLILATQFEIGKRRASILSGKLDPKSIGTYEARIRHLEDELNELRKGTVHFSMASALDNIDVLGPSYLARMKQVLPDYLFRTSILNLRPDRVEGGFYPDLDDERHTYIPSDSTFVSQAGNTLIAEPGIDDCRKDGDLVPHLPLELAPDFGASFNCLVIGQLFDREFNILNQVFVKHPHKIRDLARRFHDYYQHHSGRTYRLYYDHTMVGEDAVREYGFVLELVRELRSLGWHGEEVYIGQAPGHHEKYVFWSRRFSHADPQLPRVRWNAENCEPTLLSMRLAGARETRRGFEKDKSPEKDPNADQAETTHLSDACDLLVIGRFITLNTGASTGVDVLFG